MPMSLYKDQPTQKQLEFIKRLGYSGNSPKTKGDASDLIEKLLETERQAKSSGRGCLRTIRNAVLLISAFIVLLTYCAIRNAPPPKPSVDLQLNAPPELYENTSQASSDDIPDPAINDLSVSATEAEAPTILPPASENQTESPRISAMVDEPVTLDFRTWTDTSGKFKVEAVYIEYDGENVTLQKRNGDKSVLPFVRLSEDDQQWIRNRVLNPTNDAVTTDVE